MAIEKFQPMRKRFVKLTLWTKWITPSERALKTVPRNGFGNCVHFCLRSLGALERCEAANSFWVFVYASILLILSGFPLDSNFLAFFQKRSSQRQNIAKLFSDHYLQFNKIAQIFKNAISPYRIVVTFSFDTWASSCQFQIWFNTHHTRYLLQLEVCHLNVREALSASDAFDDLTNECLIFDVHDYWMLWHLWTSLFWQFTEIFTEEGRKSVKITHQVPNQPPRVTFTPGMRERMNDRAQALAAAQQVLKWYSGAPI